MEATTRKAGVPQAAVIIAISLLPMMAIVALMPVIPAIVQNFKDMPNIMTLAPLIVAAPGLCVALLSPYAGYLTDKLGRRKLLLIFTAFYGFGGILPFFFHTFPALIAGRLLLGVGEAFILTISNTLYGDYFTKKERTNWLTWQGVLGSACGTLLLMASGSLSKFGWYYPFLVYGFALLITLASYIFIYEPQRNTQEIKAKTDSNTPFPMNIMIKLALMTLLASTLYFVYTLHFSLALDSMGYKNGKFMWIASLGVPLGALLFRLIAHKSAQFQFASLFFLIGLGLTGIGLGGSIETVIASAFIQQLGGGMAVAVLIAWGLNNVPAEYRGRGMGFWTTGFFLGQVLCPFVVTAVRNMVGGSMLTAFLVFGIICLLLAGYYLFLSKKEVKSNF